MLLYCSLLIYLCQSPFFLFELVKNGVLLYEENIFCYTEITKVIGEFCKFLYNIIELNLYLYYNLLKKYERLLWENQIVTN